MAHFNNLYALRALIYLYNKRIVFETQINPLKIYGPKKFAE